MRRVFLLIAFMMMAVLFTGCANKAGQSEGDVKTETVVENVEMGMIPQVIEKSITYVMKDGTWQEEGAQITDWKWADDFIIRDTVWILESDDATKLYPDLNVYFKGKPAVAFIHFKSDQKEAGATIGETEDGTQKMDISISISCDIIFECNDEKFYYEGVKVSGGECFMDGTCNIFMDPGNGQTGILHVPANVKKGQWADFRNELPTKEDELMSESSTYIKKISFDNIPSFNVTSSNIYEGIWDDKITNTKYGENMSPELTWDAVDGADRYVVIMIDGAWLHMDVFTTETHLDEGAVSRGPRGEQYVGPYPPSGTHTYSVFVFALKDEPGKVKMSFDAGGNSIDLIYSGLNKDKDENTGNVIAFGRLNGNYTHKD
ncbi:MAG: hypothetical protein K5877_02695 [Lachnospiraceae bacterium]|nr:hypothetical protein [Lachnospiraceae bacterium]